VYSRIPQWSTKPVIFCPVLSETIEIMKADRLVAILLILQRKGQVTAAEVAAELEVSERTARRDLEALGNAGLPIYSTQGRNGGWQLLGGSRTDLSGLTAPEARALFLVAGPASSATPAVKAGLRKLLRALPETMQDDAESASSALIIDRTRWGQISDERPAPTWLDALQSAVITGEQVELGYLSPKGDASTRVVHPLGIAAKGTAWYLVADTEAGMRTFRIDRVSSVVGVGLPVVRPKDFDLASAWKLMVERVGDHWKVSVRALADPNVLGRLRMLFGAKLRVGPSLPDGRVDVEIGIPDRWMLIAKLAGLGASVEVTEPEDIRVELGRIGAELAQQYGHTERAKVK
jgi:predicted DNA-binding transcriptional regulator YafY